MKYNVIISSVVLYSIIIASECFFSCHQLIYSMLMSGNTGMFIIKYICLELQNFPV